MVTISNTPASNSYFRLEARKSFQLDLWFRHADGRELDLEGSAVLMSATRVVPHTPQSRDVVLNAAATFPHPSLGNARFDIQAAQLDFPVGTYAFDVTLIAGGFSGVVLKGSLELVWNTDTAALSHSFTTQATPKTLDVVLRENHVSISVGEQVPYGLLPDYVRIFENALEATP